MCLRLCVPILSISFQSSTCFRRWRVVQSVKNFVYWYLSIVKLQSSITITHIFMLSIFTIVQVISQQQSTCNNFQLPLLLIAAETRCAKISIQSTTISFTSSDWPAANDFQPRHTTIISTRSSNQNINSHQVLRAEKNTILVQLMRNCVVLNYPFKNVISLANNLCSSSSSSPSQLSVNWKKCYVLLHSIRHATYE